TAVIFDAPPDRIISYSPGATEILFAIGAGDRVVATDTFSNFPEAVATLPKLEYTGPNPEPALGLEPSVVIMATQQEQQIAQFRDLGMRVLFVREADSLEGVLQNVLDLGTLTGRAEEATALVDSLQARIDAVAETLADIATGPVVFYELDASLYSASPDTFIGGVLSQLKARNVAAGASSPFPQLTAEAVIAADPEVVLLGDAPYGESLESVAARPGWAGVSAVVEGRVFGVDPDVMNRPGPRIVDGLETLAALLYPELFDEN
ncbi:MAG TPA: ABC transporter substrate-binding protein, partial [Dehalococcoidia bacterium]|nr:ABC transporter substrate-binding protein [Dehalococcoidia bacterium]